MAQCTNIVWGINFLLMSDVDHSHVTEVCNKVLKWCSKLGRWYELVPLSLSKQQNETNLPNYVCCWMKELLSPSYRSLIQLCIALDLDDSSMMTEVVLFVEKVSVFPRKACHVVFLGAGGQCSVTRSFYSRRASYFVKTATIPGLDSPWAQAVVSSAKLCQASIQVLLEGNVGASKEELSFLILALQCCCACL